MSRQAVMATLKAAGGSSGTGPGIRYIGSSIPSNGSRVYANGSNSASGSILIDKIAEISSTSTKYTTIECTATYGVDPPRSMSGNRSSKSKDESMLIISNFSLFIDWDHPGGGKMVFQGRYTFPGGSDDRHTGWQFYNGEYSIEAAGGSITMSPTSDHMGRGPRSSGGPILKYNANRQVTGVPVIDGPTHLVGSCALHSYTITTDTGITVVAAPEPPAADVVTVTQEVSGKKISELNAADSLNDTDLFVLSRDDPAGGPYDESLNVTLENLKADISAAGSLASRTVRGYVGGDFIGSDGTGAQTITSSDSMELDAKTYKVLAGFNAWLGATNADITIELQYELNGSGGWVQFADLKTKKTRTGGSGHGYLWTVSPMGIAEFVAPSAGSYKFRMDASSATLLIHDFSVIVL
jgi:hypothetical protein